MSLFCFLVVPLFIAFRHSLGLRGGRKGLTPAFTLGLIAALLRSAIGDMVPAGLFGFLRWLHLFIDRAAFPALLPFAVWWFVKKSRRTGFDVGLTDFALVWLMPVAAIRTIAWSAAGSPLELVLTPLLWLCVVIGVPSLIDAAEEEFGMRAFGAASLALALPLVGTTAAWAFFVHTPLLGFILFAVCAAPAVWTTAVAVRAAAEADSPQTTLGDGADVDR